MKAWGEDLTWIVRVGRNGSKHGDPWEYAVTCVSVDNKTAIVKALKGDAEFTMAHARAIMRFNRQKGFKSEWGRYKNRIEKIIKGNI